MDEIKHEPGGSAIAAGAVPGRDMDRDLSRRPGVPRLRAPAPLPNTRYPPEQQRSDATVFMHGRPHKTFPPVFGTDVPPRGVSGMLRRAAYRHPDHVMRHWTMLLFADRVDLWEHRARKMLGAAAIAAGLLVVAATALGRARR